MKQRETQRQAQRSSKRLGRNLCGGVGSRRSSGRMQCSQRHTYKST